MDDRSINKKKSLKSINFPRLLTGIIAALFIFGLGVSIGGRKFSIGKDRVFQKSVQKDKLPADLDYSSVEQLYDALKQQYDGQLEADSLLDGLKQGLAKATGDEYTEYLNKQEAKEFAEDLSGTFTGIGAELSKDKDAIVIISPIAGFPAEKAGLKPKDIIAEIDGESSYDISISEAVKRIRGPKDTKVKLKVIREGQSPLDIEITRDQINVPSVTSETLPGNIGYLKIARFSEDTAGLTKKAAQQFKAAGVKGVILDVRSDPGGLLDGAVDVASVWLPKGKMVLQERRDGIVVKTYNSTGQPLLQGVPTVVLINEGSASASEIVAGALKDNGVATLIGTKTFGKGSVQRLLELSDGGELKVTIARWYTPGGKNIDKEGISPDQEVKRSDDDFKNKLDPQKDAAIKSLSQ